MKHFHSLVAMCLSMSHYVAAQPPVDPIPRVEAGTHTAMIRRLAVDEPRGRMITVSDDKTARVWEIATGRLLRTLRIPIGADNEGRLSSVALAPASRLVALGGWTSFEWDSAASVYIYDLDTGKLVQRISQLPGVVTYLHFTRDGKFLAVGLSGGLRVVRTSDWGEALADDEYADRVVGIDDGPAGLVTSSLDGALRVYGSDLRLSGRHPLAAVGTRPVMVEFSPRGDRLAVGFIDVPRVAVLDSKTFGLLAELGPTDSASYQNLPGVAWTSDGTTLLAIGDTVGDRAEILRWTTRGAPLPSIGVAAQRLTAVAAMTDGRLAVASEDPAFGVLDASGTVDYWVAPTAVQFEDSRSDLLVSPDGRAVQFKYRAGDSQSAVFRLDRRAIETTFSDDDRRRATDSRAGLRVENWRDVQAGAVRPSINGAAVAIEEFDISRSVAVAERTDRVLFGSDWGLYLFDSGANLIWRRRTEQVAWAVNMSADGQFAVAALSDGSIRWFRMTDGAEVMAVYVHPNRKDWIAWVPQGYYASSLRGDEFIGWHLNRGSDTEADFFRAVQFERELFRPDLVDAYFASAGAAELAKPSLAAIAPPRLALRTASSDSRAARSATIVVEAESTSLPMLDFAVYVNGIPTTQIAHRRVAQPEQQRFSRTLEAPLDGRDNVVRVEVFNGRSMGVVEQYIPGATTPGSERRGDLYILSVGVNRFDDGAFTNLAFAVNDATRLQAYFASLEGTLFDKVHRRLLVDRPQGEAPLDSGLERAAAPTKANIERALEFLQQATGDDTVIITLASHGLSDARGNYYFVPVDGRGEDARRVRADSDGIETLVSWKTFFDALRLTAGKRLLVVDTCESSDMEGSFDAFALAKRSTASAFALMTAAQGNQDSQEYSSPSGAETEGQGLFTYALLRGLEQSTDSDGDGRTSLQELFQYAFPIVQELHDPTVGPQTPELVAPAPLDELTLAVSRATGSASRARRGGAGEL